MNRPMEELLNAEGWTARAGTAAAADDFDALVRQQQRRIYRVLYAMLRDVDAAETLTQDTFLRAYQRRRDYRGEGSVEGWLLRIGVNLARDYLRSRRAGFWTRLFRGEAAEAAEATAADERAGPERVLLGREQAGMVWQVAEELSPQQRAVFVLRFVEEMSLEEIARATGLRVGTVKVHLFRAVSVMRQRLKGVER